MPIQGTQADMIKRAMISVDRKLTEGGYGARMLLQVHDELVLEVPMDEVEAVRAMVVKEMSEALPLQVPIEVSTGIGSNWLEAH